MDSDNYQRVPESTPIDSRCHSETSCQESQVQQSKIASSVKCVKCEDKPCSLNWDPTQPKRKSEPLNDAAKKTIDCDVVDPFSEQRLKEKDCVDHFCEQGFQFKDHNIYDRALASENISRSVITPIDEVSICQVIKDPQNEARTFVVERVTPAHPAQTKKDKNDIDAFTFSKLTAKTSNHATYDHQKVKETGKETKLEQVKCQDYQNQKHAVVSVYERICDKQKQKKHEINDEGVEQSQKAQLEENEPFECTSQFYVENPVYLEDTNHRAKKFVSNMEDRIFVDSYLRLPQLFFCASNGDLHYFSQSKTDEFVLEKVELEKIEQNSVQRKKLPATQKVKINKDENYLLYQSLKQSLGIENSKSLLKFPEIIGNYMIFKGYEQQKFGEFLDKSDKEIKYQRQNCKQNQDRNNLKFGLCSQFLQLYLKPIHNITLLFLETIHQNFDLRDSSSYQQEILIVNMHDLQTILKLPKSVLFIGLEIKNINDTSQSLAQDAGKDTNFSVQLDVYTLQTERHEEILDSPRFKFVKYVYQRTSVDWLCISTRETKYMKEQKQDQEMQIQNDEEKQNQMKNKFSNKVLHEIFLQIVAWGTPKVNFLQSSGVNVQVFIPRLTHYYGDNYYNVLETLLIDDEYDQNQLNLGFQPKFSYVYSNSSQNLHSNVVQENWYSKVEFLWEGKNLGLRTTNKLLSQRVLSTNDFSLAKDLRLCQLISLDCKNSEKYFAVLFQDSAGLVHLTFSLAEEVNLESFLNSEKVDHAYQKISFSMRKIVEYPILAYTQMFSNQHKICLVNLALNTTQLKIDLGQYKFLDFLQTQQEGDKIKNSQVKSQKELLEEKEKLGDKKSQLLKMIHILVRDQNQEVKVMTFRIDVLGKDKTKLEIADRKQLNSLITPGTQLNQSFQFVKKSQNQGRKDENLSIYLVERQGKTRIEVTNDFKVEPTILNHKNILPIPLFAGLKSEVYYLTAEQNRTSMHKIYMNDDNEIIDAKVFEYRGLIVQLKPVVKDFEGFQRQELKFKALDSHFNVLDILQDDDNAYKCSNLNQKPLTDSHVIYYVPDLLIYQPSIGISMNWQNYKEFLNALRKDANKSFLESQGLAVIRSEYTSVQTESYDQTQILDVDTIVSIERTVVLIKSYQSGLCLFTQSNPLAREYQLFDYKDVQLLVKQIEMTDGFIFITLRNSDDTFTILVYNRITLLIYYVIPYVLKFENMIGTENIVWVQTKFNFEQQKVLTRCNFSFIYALNFGKCTECISEQQEPEKRLLQVIDLRKESEVGYFIKTESTLDGRRICFKICNQIEKYSEFDYFEGKDPIELQIIKPVEKQDQKQIEFDFDNPKAANRQHMNLEVSVKVKTLDDLPSKIFDSETQIIICGDYIVLRINQAIIFTKFDLDKDSDSIKTVKELNKKTINLRSNFFGFLYDNVSILSLGNNILQIVGFNKLITWNLKENHQVKVLMNQRIFLETQRFAKTEFKICDQEYDESEMIKRSLFISTNHQQTAFCKHFSGTQVGAYFTTFSMIDLRQFKVLTSLLKEPIQLKRYDCNQQTFVAQVYGRSIFETHLDSELNILKKLNDIIFQNRSTLSYKEQLSQVIMQPISREAMKNLMACNEKLQNEQEQKKISEIKWENKNIIEFFFEIQAKYQNFKGPQILNYLYRPIRHSQNNHFPFAISSVEHFSYISIDLKEMNQAQALLKDWKFNKSVQFGRKVFIPVVNCEETIYLKTQTDQLSLAGLKCLLKEKINPTNELTEKIICVNVYAYKINQYMKRIQDFFVEISCSDDPETYKDNFLLAMLEQQDQSQMTKRIYMPYLLYLASCLHYFQRSPQDENETSLYINRVMIMIGNLFFAYIEIRQLINEYKKTKGIKSYLYSFWNICMIIILALNTSILIKDQFELVSVYSVILPSLSSFLMVFQLFYLNQMIKGQQMYFSVFSGVLLDSGPLYFNGFILLFCLAMAMVVIQKKQILIENNSTDLFQVEEAQEMVEPITERFGNLIFINSYFQQYLGMLGEFELLDAGVDLYPQGVQILVWFWFLLSTVLTQLLFLNLLIGAMAESYNKRWEIKELYGRMQLYKMFADFQDFITFKRCQEQFIYVIEPTEFTKEETSEIQEMKSDLQNLQESVDQIYKVVKSLETRDQNLKNNQTGKE